MHLQAECGKSSRITEMLTKDRSSDVLEEMAARRRSATIASICCGSS